jgi:hypothetical protein
VLSTQVTHIYQGLVNKMPKKASVKYKSLRTNFVHLPLSIYASLVQQQAVSQACNVAGISELSLPSYESPWGFELRLKSAYNSKRPR